MNNRMRQVSDKGRRRMSPVSSKLSAILLCAVFLGTVSACGGQKAPAKAPQSASIESRSPSPASPEKVPAKKKAETKPVAAKPEFKKPEKITDEIIVQDFLTMLFKRHERVIKKTGKNVPFRVAALKYEEGEFVEDEAMRQAAISRMASYFAKLDKQQSRITGVTHSAFGTEKQEPGQVDLFLEKIPDRHKEYIRKQTFEGPVRWRRKFTVLGPRYCYHILGPYHTRGTINLREIDRVARKAESLGYTHSKEVPFVRVYHDWSCGLRVDGENYVSNHTDIIFTECTIKFFDEAELLKAGLGDCLLSSLGLLDKSELFPEALIGVRAPYRPDYYLGEDGVATWDEIVQRAPTEFTEADRLYLTILYNPRIKSGMSREEVEKIVREILPTIKFDRAALLALTG